MVSKFLMKKLQAYLIVMPHTDLAVVVTDLGYELSCEVICVLKNQNKGMK